MEPHTGLNNLDYFVLGVILLSAFFALFRGFLREVLSLVAWVVAYFAAVKYHGLLEPTIHRYIKTESLLMPLSAAGVFLIALVGLSIVFAIIASFVRGRGLTAIDRSLGFLFGMFRGALIVCLVYMAVVSVFWPEMNKMEREQQPPPELQAQQSPQDQQAADQKEQDKGGPPGWLMQAKTQPAMAFGSRILESFISKEELEKSTKNAEIYINREYGLQKAAAEKAMEQKELDRMSTPVPAAPNEVMAPTYDTQSRDGIDKLINQRTP